MAIPIKIEDRLKKGLTKYQKILQELKDRGTNEADTSTIVNRILEEVLGYDLLNITAEYRIRGQYADYAIKDKNKPVLIIEVKPVGSILSSNHLYQATNYAATQGVEWAVLTNAICWQTYHLSFGKNIEKELVFKIDILDKEIKTRKKIDLLYYLTKESFFKNEIRKYWQQQLALSAKNINNVILSDSVIEKIRRELRAKTGYTITPEDLKSILKNKILNL